MNLTDVLTVIRDGGAIGALGFITFAFIKGWIVPGHTYQDIIQDRDDWKEMALSGANAAERALDMAESQRRRRPRTPNAPKF